MRYFMGLVCVLALGVMGCGGTDVCEGVECDDGNECTEDICADGVCDYAPVENRTACGEGPGACEAGICVGGVFACTEQGIRDAVAVGGGPHTFDCADGTTIVTTGSILVYNDVILNGEGLTVDGDLEHEVFIVGDVTAELHGFTVTRGGSPECVGGSFLCGYRSGILISGTLTLTNSTVSGNRDHGIALAGGTATLTLTNSTVSGNAFAGISIFGGGTLTLTNSTVSGNRDYGIALSHATSTATLTNSLITGNCKNGGEDDDIVSNGYNIESPGDTCGFDQPSDQVNVSADALALGPLQDNGGPTETHALLPGSVAIDQIRAVDCVDAEGEPLTTDQRGQPRPGGSMCDVGAFEVQEAGE